MKKHKRIAVPIETDELCHYSCGQKAKYRNGSGNLMCEERSSKCPAVKSKNSKGVLKAHKDGKLPGWNGQVKLNRGWAKGKTAATDSRINANYDPSQMFSYGGKGPHKKVLIDERGHICEKCGNSEWLGKHITLELEHKDGDNKNNIKDNLELLCPNCHSQTKTWRRAKDKYKYKRNKKHTDEDMIAAIKESSNLNQALDKLDLKWGSAKTLVRVMGEYQINFKDD